MGLRQFLKKYYEYDKEDLKDEKLNVDDYKIFKILDNAVEGNIDFDKFSVLHRDVGEYFDVGAEQSVYTFSAQDIDDLVQYKRERGDKVDEGSAEIIKEIFGDEDIIEDIVKYSKLWDKIIDGKADYVDLYHVVGPDFSEDSDKETYNRAMELYLLPKGKLNDRQASNLKAFKDIMNIEDEDVRKDVIHCMQQYSSEWDKDKYYSEEGYRLHIKENGDNEAYIAAFNIYMNKQKRDNPKKFEKQNSRAVVVEELHEQEGELPVANYKAQSQSMRFDKRLEVHQVETEDTKTKSETNKNEKQSQNYKFLVEVGNVMD